MSGLKKFAKKQQKCIRKIEYQRRLISREPSSRGQVSSPSSGFLKLQVTPMGAPFWANHVVFRGLDWPVYSQRHPGGLLEHLQDARSRRILLKSRRSGKVSGVSGPWDPESVFVIGQAIQLRESMRGRVSRPESERDSSRQLLWWVNINFPSGVSCKVCLLKTFHREVIKCQLKCTITTNYRQASLFVNGCSSTAFDMIN